MDQIHGLLNCAYAEYNAPDFLSTFIAQRSNDLASVLSDNAVIAINAEMDTDTIFSTVCSHIELPSSPPEHVHQGFATCQVLNYALARLANDHTLEAPFPEILEVLQKRFEVNHRLFTRYDGAIRKSGDDYTDMQVYALSAIVFIKLFLLKHNFTYLNTAIKLNTLILKSGWPIERKDQPLVYAAVVLEQKIVTGEYEKNNF